MINIISIIIAIFYIIISMNKKRLKYFFPVIILTLPNAANNIFPGIYINYPNAIGSEPIQPIGFIDITLLMIVFVHKIRVNLNLHNI